jgi:hypothetical protein
MPPPSGVTGERVLSPFWLGLTSSQVLNYRADSGRLPLRLSLPFSSLVSVCVEQPAQRSL